MHNVLMLLKEIYYGLALLTCGLVLFSSNDRFCDSEPATYLCIRVYTYIYIVSVKSMHNYVDTSASADGFINFSCMDHKLIKTLGRWFRKINPKIRYCN